jgi:hypothetical protein
MRPITNTEEQLITHLLSYLPTRFRIPDQVVVLIDGNMGSIKFVDPENRIGRKYSNDLIQASYNDKDGIYVLITLTLDNYNNLFELEFWKTDFSKLIDYPKPNQVQIIVNK